MLKQLVTLFASFALFTTSFAAVSGTSALQNAIDDLNYDLTVQWDQRDADFYRGAVASFEYKLNALKNEGLTNDQIADALVANIKDDQSKEEVKELLATIEANDLSSAEITELVSTYSKSMQSTGANYAGAWDSVSKSLFGVALVGLMVAAIYYGFQFMDDVEDMDFDSGSSTPSRQLMTENYTYTCPYSGSGSVPVQAYTRACMDAKKYYFKTNACNDMDNYINAMNRCTSACGISNCSQDG